MRTGREETNQRSIIGASDSTNGGAIVLGYGNNFTPTDGGNSTWALRAEGGSIFRLRRINSSGTVIDPLTISESTGRVSFPFGATVTSSSGDAFLLINGNSGASGLIRFDDAGTPRWRLGKDSSNDFFLYAYNSSGTFTGQPIVVDNETNLVTVTNFAIGPSNTVGFRDINLVNSTGSLKISGNPSGTAKTQFLQNLDGTIALIEVPQPIQSYSTNVTLNTGTAGAYIRLTNSTEISVTVPDNATQPHPIGTVIQFIATNGWVTLAASVGVTINDRTPFPLSLIPRGLDFKLRKIGTNEWDLTCDPWDPTRIFVNVHEFMSQTGNDVYSTSTSGSISGVLGTASNPGGIQLSTASSASAVSSISTEGTAIVSSSGGGRWFALFEGCSVSIPADGANDYVARLGFLSTTGSSLPGEGAFFQHSTANSGNWEFVLRDGGTTTSTGSSSAASSEANLSVLMKPGAAHIFSIGGTSTSVGTNQIISIVRAGALIAKTAGTTARSLTIRRMTLIGELY